MKRNSISIRMKIMIWFSLSILLIVGITLALTFSICYAVASTGEATLVLISALYTDWASE